MKPDATEFSLTLGRTASGARALHVEGLSYEREWELLEIIARMRIEDAARGPDPSPPPARGRDDAEAS